MKKNTFKVYGSGEELTWGGGISPKLAKKIIETGVSETLKNELISDSECGITSDINIKVNNKSIKFDVADFEKRLDQENLNPAILKNGTY